MTGRTRRVWLLKRRPSGMPRIYHVNPGCGRLRRGRLAETTERQARKVARLCGTCRRAYGAPGDRDLDGQWAR